MPSQFQTSMLVTALLAASGARAQLYFNLETNEFSSERKPKVNPSEEDSLPHHHHHVPFMTRDHDAEDWRYLEE